MAMPKTAQPMMGLGLLRGIEVGMNGQETTTLTALDTRLVITYWIQGQGFTGGAGGITRTTLPPKGKMAAKAIRLSLTGIKNRKIPKINPKQAKFFLNKPKNIDYFLKTAKP